MRLNLNEDYFNDNQVVLNLHGGEKYLGRVEVCIMTAYHTLCYKGREDSYAPTICKQLGFSPYGKFSCIIHFRMIVIMLILFAGAVAVRSRFFFNLEPSRRSPLSLQCARYTTDSIDQCDHLSLSQCVLDEAGVVCQGGQLLIIIVPLLSSITFALIVLDTPAGNCSNGDIRLADGRSVLEGRVEICFNNAWGTVCGDTFSSYDAHVVCTSLGLPFNGLLVIVCIVNF